jgi:hypothetical protein
LALEVHGVAGAGFVGGVAGEESVGETSLTLFVFAFSAVLEPATNVGAHGWPKVVPGERGMHLGVGEVVKVGVVLASERFAEGERNHDARGEVGIAEDVKTLRALLSSDVFNLDAGTLLASVKARINFPDCYPAICDRVCQLGLFAS